MNAVRGVASALLSTEPLEKQRPFWAGAVLPVGSLMMTLFGKSSGQSIPLVAALGMVIAAAGLLLLLRYFIISYRNGRIRTKAL